MILGTCVSRDAFASSESEDFEVVEYTARTSFASLAQPARIIPEIVETIQSPFQKRMVMRDMSKAFWTLLDIEFDLFVIDLIDERFRIARFEDGSVNTISAEYLQGSKNTALPPHQVLSQRHPQRQKMWNRGLQRLHDALSQRGLLEKVVINRVYWAETTKMGADDKRLLANNGLLQSYYDRMERFFPASRFIDYPVGLLRSDVDHRWNEAPFHYSQDTYRHFIDRLRQL
jgi:hypothetical protein